MFVFLSVAEVVTLRTLFVRLLQLFMRERASSLFSRLTLHGNVEILVSFDMTSRWHSSFLFSFFSFSLLTGVAFMAPAIRDTLPFLTWSSPFLFVQAVVVSRMLDV